MKVLTAVASARTSSSGDQLAAVIPSSIDPTISMAGSSCSKEVVLLRVTEIISPVERTITTVFESEK